MKRSVWIVFGCVLVVIPALAQAKASDELGALVDRVDAQYAQITDFQADFVQETRIQGFDTADPLFRSCLSQETRPAPLGLHNPLGRTHLRASG